MRKSSARLINTESQFGRPYPQHMAVRVIELSERKTIPYVVIVSYRQATLLIASILALWLVFFPRQYSAGSTPVVSFSLGGGGDHDVRFIEYVSSAWEQEWKDNVQLYQKNPCGPLLDAQGAAKSDAFLTLVQHFRKQPHHLADAISSNSFDVLSHFVYSVDSRKFQVAIEPLVGYYRHPYAVPACTPVEKETVDVLDLSYILFHGMPLIDFHAIYPGRIYLFDLGINGPNRSIAWFDRYYREYGITFDQIWGWDSKHFEPTEFWRNVPKTMHSKFHLINTKVDHDITSSSHPYQIIKRIYRKGDYIALKLDIDSPGYEQILADQLLHDDALADMVADFFYEKHFGAPHFPHHAIPPDDPVHNMASVMQFFSDLRAKGIRAHYWV